MKKITVSAAFLTLMIMMPLLAGGTQEPERRMKGNGGTELPGMNESDKLTLEGDLNRIDDLLLQLVTQDETWNIMIPPERLEELTLEETIFVTLEGFSIPAPPEAETTDNNFLMATAIIIDGERYEIEGGRPDRGQGGPGGQGGQGGGGRRG